MIEREINLLAPRIIRLRSYRIYLERVGHLVRGVTWLAVVLLVIIGGVYAVTRWTQVSLTSGTDPADERNRATITQARRINTQLGAIKAWQVANVSWTPYLPQVLRTMPEGFVLTHISVDKETRALELGGTFPRREALVTFQRQLETLPWVLTVKSPLSNFETGNDAQFTLHIVRKEEL